MISFALWLLGSLLIASISSARSSIAITTENLALQGGEEVSLTFEERNRGNALNTWPGLKPF